VTGAANIDLADVATRIAGIRAVTRLPIGVGFGIRDPDTAKRIAGVADAVIIGSRLVQEIENSRREQVVSNVTAFLSGIRQAMDGRAREEVA
jgi:tryptophan synthase alpha chain